MSQVIDFLSQSPVKSILKKGRRFQSSGLRLRYTPVDGRIIKVRDRNVRRREWLSPRTLMGAVSLLRNLRIALRNRPKSDHDGRAEKHASW